MKISVFIVDDHFMVIEGIKSLLQNEQDIEWMGHATKANSCLAYLQLHQPDVVLMDINLPDQSGTDLCKQVKQLYPAIHILGLSTFNQQHIIRNMMDNGASGYVLKNANKEELLTAIKKVAFGKIYYSPDVTVSLRTQGNHTPIISRREKEVLLLIAEGLTNAEIADKLFISITTVNTHRKSLLAKFDASNTASLIKMAVQQKFV